MKFKVVFLAIIFTIVIITFVVTTLTRSARKGGIKNFLKKKNIDYQAILEAYESGHFIAVDRTKSVINLVKYSKKKKEYQLKTFDFSEIERADFYRDGIRIASLSAEDKVTKIKLVPDPLSRNVISVRLFIKGAQYPYIMTIDQVAEGNGSSIANSRLTEDLGKWNSNLNTIFGHSTVVEEILSASESVG